VNGRGVTERGTQGVGSRGSLLEKSFAYWVAATCFDYPVPYTSIRPLLGPDGTLAGIGTQGLEDVFIRVQNRASYTDESS
jgi:hypothetical protein